MVKRGWWIGRVHWAGLACWIGLFGLAGCRPEPTSTPSPAAEETEAAEAAPMSDASAEDLMYIISDQNFAQADEAIQIVREAGDERFIPVFIELLRAGQLRIVEPAVAESGIDALEDLSGQRFGWDWPLWIEWYGATDIEPPPGFTTWKGRLLARIDPGFAAFLNSEYPSRIRSEEIQWGGVMVDGIPALDEPVTLSAEEADYLGEDEPVFGLVIDEDARAYPLRIVDWHEMVNDTVGGVPISLAYCTLCGAAIAFDGRASDGEVYTFGSSGFLYRSNKLMYDRNTRTLWNQFTGEPVLGELADGDITLTIHPVLLTTWGEWKSRHPQTRVLDIETGFSRVYEPGAAYADYFASDGTMFPVWQRNDLLEDKSQVFVLRLEGIPKAYPFKALIDERVINDTVGETDLVVVASGEVITVGGISLRSGREREYAAGMEVRAFRRGGNEFAPGAGSDTLLDQDGAAWSISDEGLLGPGGQTLERLAGHLAYWFGWYAFFPDSLVYGIDQ